MVAGRNWLSSGVLAQLMLRAATAVTYDPALGWQIVRSPLSIQVTRTNEYSQTDMSRGQSEEPVQFILAAGS
jgi:hypothetical protein